MSKCSDGRNDRNNLGNIDLPWDEWELILQIVIVNVLVEILSSLF
jgi:hypothetical protein